jgi:hypothetical protein
VDLSNPAFWGMLSVLFVVAAAMNLARGISRTDDRRRVNLVLAGASVLFAMTAATYRFVNHNVGYAAGAVAVIVWMYAAAIAPRKR